MNCRMMKGEINVEHSLTPTEALALMQNARNLNQPEAAFALFQRACQGRKQMLGDQLWWTSGSGGIFPCHVVPRCSYCSFFTEDHFPIDALLRGLELIENMGIRQFHISGGTDLNGGFEEPLLAMVRTIREHSSLQLEVNLGPSFSEQTVMELKHLGVESITSSLECTNPEIFSTVKPGDSLDRRQDLLETCEKISMPSRTMMLVGLGESDEDRIAQLFYLKQFRELYQLRISRFMPFSGTALQSHPRCSPWETALVTAIARLILPDREISLAAGNGTEDIPLWYLAGGGNQLLGVSITRHMPKASPDVIVHEIGEQIYVVDKRKEIERILEGMLLKI
ncbi:radical SAM protein [Lacrimispora sp.]|uniref:radical SAM protein n=1 Tax=Lacrimispora sp. TaxID=2719234 RepID=UPI00289914B7|nr:radical SAM protein [Lacrimispora sp.]